MTNKNICGLGISYPEDYQYPALKNQNLMINTACKNNLEILIDTSSLAQVIESLSEICWEKAEHLRSNWQDETSALAWERAGNRLSGVSANHYISAVS
jgi:hypothetical protein